MQKEYISIAHAAFSTAQAVPNSVHISSFTRGIYALLSPAPTFWRVVGITRTALSILLDNLDAKRLPKGLQRAHICQRADPIKTLLNGPTLSLEEFERAVLGEADYTILCAKGENNNQLASRNDIIRIKNIGDDPLFQPHGFAARWSELEKNCVRNLSSKH